MTRMAYIEKNFKADSLAIIEKADQIIEEYTAQGYSLTLRQLYYQFVARGLLPNTQRSYKNLGSIINDARLAGLIDWEAIEDRTRNLRRLPSWSSPAAMIETAAQLYHLDLWRDQDVRCEVWIEKEALVGVIERVCDKWDVPYFACRGYSSQSEQWRAGQRFLQYLDRGQNVCVFHLGDHDPSGIDMTRDNQDRLNLFVNEWPEGVEVRRLALNIDQVEQYNPPPNPAKLTDSRANGYVLDYGHESWELDALDPSVIAGLIEDAITSVLDVKRFNARQRQQEHERKALLKLQTQFNKQQ